MLEPAESAGVAMTLVINATAKMMMALMMFFLLFSNFITLPSVTVLVLLIFSVNAA